MFETSHHCLDISFIGFVCYHKYCHVQNKYCHCVLKTVFIYCAMIVFMRNFNESDKDQQWQWCISGETRAHFLDLAHCLLINQHPCCHLDDKLWIVTTVMWLCVSTAQKRFCKGDNLCDVLRSVVIWDSHFFCNSAKVPVKLFQANYKEAPCLDHSREVCPKANVPLDGIKKPGNTQDLLKKLGLGTLGNPP